MSNAVARQLGETLGLEDPNPGPAAVDQYQINRPLVRLETQHGSLGSTMWRSVSEQHVHPRLQPDQS